MVGVFSNCNIYVFILFTCVEQILNLLVYCSNQSTLLLCVNFEFFKFHRILHVSCKNLQFRESLFLKLKVLCSAHRALARNHQKRKIVEKEKKSTKKGKCVLNIPDTIKIFV